MIPKVIHYCWFGGNSKPEFVQKCIESWKQYCPEYKIVEWNESNFDVNCIDYVKCAYQDKKWAFVSDYARLWIIYNNGGIYLDTDVLLKNNLDDLLSYDCWLASDDVRYINTGLGFGAVKNHYIIEILMNAYSNYEYPSGTNVSRDTKVLENLLPNWRKSDTNQILDGILIIGLKDYGKNKVKEIRNSVKVLPSEIKDKRLLDRFIFKISNFSFGLELVCRIRNWLKVGI